MRLIQFPIGIFGVAMAMAALPALSEHAVKGDMDKLREDFSFALRLLFFITVPAMAGLIALREPIVNILFQRGVFDYMATIGTADALLFYSTGIWAIVGMRVVTSTFYSLQDTKTPVRIAVIAMITNIVMSIILMGPLRHSGLAFANSIASGLNFILLFYILKRKLGRIDARRILRSFMKVCIASAVMGVSGRIILHGEIWMLSERLIEKAVYLSGTIILCLGIYLIICYLLRSDEMDYVYSALRSILRRDL
jgi:putative peptidoglycan lipid II flippase